MTNKTIKSLLATTAVSLAVVGAAQAGGFSRGDADTQIIYEEGNFNMRSSVTIVSPTRKYTRATNPALVGEDYADTYLIPSAAVKMNLNDDLRCAATMVNNLGAKSSTPGGNDVIGVGPSGPVYGGTIKTDLSAYEFGATCGYKFDLSKGRLWVVGGGFAETLDVLKVANVGAPIPATLNLDGTAYGWRAGLAYEIPEIALRAELMYRSGTSYGAKGTFTVPVAVAPGPPPVIVGVPLNSSATGDLPQSVDLNLQSGIAPGWLAFASVKWTDWSVTRSLDVTTPGAGPLEFTQDTFYWRDGWTVSGGIGHAFNDQVSGLVAITWDRGVGTGYDLSGDVWTLSVGGSVKDKWGGELRGGVGLSRLGSASEYNEPGATGVVSAVGTDYSIAGNIGYAIKW